MKAVVISSGRRKWKGVESRLFGGGGDGDGDDDGAGEVVAVVFVGSRELLNGEAACWASSGRGSSSWIDVIVCLR